MLAFLQSNRLSAVKTECQLNRIQETSNSKELDLENSIQHHENDLINSSGLKLEQTIRVC